MKEELIRAGYVIADLNDGKAIRIRVKWKDNVDYYPKSNRVHVHKTKTWYDNGNSWIKKELLGEE